MTYTPKLDCQRSFIVKSTLIGEERKTVVNILLGIIFSAATMDQIIQNAISNMRIQATSHTLDISHYAQQMRANFNDSIHNIISYLLSGKGLWSDVFTECIKEALDQLKITLKLQDELLTRGLIEVAPQPETTIEY